MIYITHSPLPKEKELRKGEKKGEKKEEKKARQLEFRKDEQRVNEKPAFAMPRTSRLLV